MNSIKNASSYSFDMKLTLSQDGNPPTIQLGKWYWRTPGDLRMEDRSIGRTLIAFRNKPGLTLDSMNKVYQDIPAKQGLDSRFMLLERIGEQLKETSTTLGTRSIAGVTCQGFEIDLSRVWPEFAYADGTMEVWVDTKSQLPASLSMRSCTDQQVEGLWENFVWNQTLDDALFSTVRPLGFRDATEPYYPLQVKLDKITSAFQLWAEMFNGKYPQVSNVYANIAMGTLKDKAGYNKSVPDDKMLTDPLYKRIQDSAAGWHFINQIRSDNPEAAYHGLQVGPEDKNKVLFRWKLEDGSYQSIYGDLRTERTKPR